MKKVFFTIFIVILTMFIVTTLTSCKKNEYKDISSTGIDYPICSNAPVQSPKIFLDHDYAFDVTDDSIFVYTEDNKLVGAVKLQGQLDSLITADNE